MNRGIVATLVFAIVTGILVISQHAGAQGGQWGTVKGRITWGGKETPIPQPIAVVKTHQDANACTMDGKVDLKDEIYVVNATNKGLRWTFVWLTREDVKSKDPPPIHPDLKELKAKEVEMDQPLCAFVPRAVALREGQTLVAKNSARINHSFKWAGSPATPNEGGNVIIAAGASFPIKGLVADKQPIQIGCAIHNWMRGCVLVFNHPYYAVTDVDGAFEFKNAPAGAYRLMVRHDSGYFRGGAAGKNGQVITIKAGGTLDLGNLEFSPPA